MSQHRGDTPVEAWARVPPVSPHVQVMGARRAPEAPRTDPPRPPRMALTGAVATLDLLARLGVMDAWSISRFTEDAWTSLAVQPTTRARDRASGWAMSQAAACRVGVPVPREQTLSHHLITGPAPVAIPDLARSTVPGVPQLAQTWGLRSFLGIGLIGPDGALLGSLDAVSAAPAQLDLKDWAEVLMAQGRAVEGVLYTDFASLEGRRRTLHERAMQTADRTTGLPDRRGWGVLLAGEEELCTPLGCPVGLVLVDLGVVRSVRGMRRAVSVVTTSVDGAEVVRVGPRQLGVVVGGMDRTEVQAMATVTQSRLEGAGFRTATASTMRAGLEPLSDTWLRAEHALIAARRERSRQVSR